MGSRCRKCEHPNAMEAERCSLCGELLRPAAGADDRLASAREVRIFGIYCAVVGAGLARFCAAWAFHGIMPVSWLGWFMLLLGAAMIMFPDTGLFRERVGRLKQLGR